MKVNSKKINQRKNKKFSAFTLLSLRGGEQETCFTRRLVWTIRSINDYSNKIVQRHSKKKKKTCIFYNPFKDEFRHEFPNEVLKMFI